ncbi:MAG: hypothetical protein IKA72_04175 [Clostridia bacterium]|nr:hypothetical protein [Clostridia bacterium]
MKTFKNYSPEQSPPINTVDREQPSSPVSPDIENFAKQMLGQYEGKSGMEMFRALLRQAEESKRAGTLTNEQIDEFYEQFSPMLNSIQRKKLQEIISDLKKL